MTNPSFKPYLLAIAIGLASLAMAANERQRIRFDDDWRFNKDNTIPPRTAKGPFKWRYCFVSGSFATINPSQFKDQISSDVEVGWNQMNESQRLAWFQTELGAGKARGLHFDGVDDNAAVFLNGVLLTRHYGWSDPFDVDLTKAWNPAGPNKLDVFVENTGGSGGIYRGVDFVDLKVITKAPPMASPSYDDRTWRHVQLPFDYIVEGSFTQTADNSHGSLPTYPAWFRKSFAVPAGFKGKSIWIDFDGIYRKGTVWLNGHRLGTHESGYTGARYDIAPYLNYRGKNVIAVYVDPRQSEGWWYEGGGIYRHVWLNAANPVHILPNGVYVRTETHPVAGHPIAPAKLTLETTVKSVSKNLFLDLNYTVIDSANHVVAKSAVRIPSGTPGFNRISSSMKLPSAKLWSVEHPNLYRLVARLVQRGRVVDEQTTTFGVRSLRYDAEKGFFLNEVPVKIQGTCNHQDFIGVGTAMPDSVLDWRIKKLKEMGSNAYRSSHNPATNELLDACDRQGMLVMEENRHLGGTYSDHTASGTPIGDLKDLRDMVVRDRNHPSIIMWSMCNEEGLQGTPEGRTIFTAMMEAVKELDATRPVTAAMNGGWGEGWSLVQDLQGCNYNPGGYDAFHKAHPDKPMFGSETASAISTRGVYENNRDRGYVTSYDTNFPGWGNTVQNCWQPIGERPFVAGGFVWTGFDYKGEPTPYGWPSINSQFGIMDTCGFPKDSWYWYKAWWGTQPVVHLLPHWNWSGREGQPISVWCYSNADRVELWLNGRSLGSNPVPRYGHAEWKVPYEPGTLVARGYRGNKVIGEDRVVTTGTPAAVRLSTDRTRLLPDGEDVTMVSVEVVDAQGHVVPTAENLVEFTISGAGTVAGVGNGYPNSHESDIAPRRKAWAGKCMVLVRGTHQAGMMVLTARAKGLKAATLKLVSK